MSERTKLVEWPEPPGDMADERQEYRYVLESYRAAMSRLRVAVAVLEHAYKRLGLDPDTPTKEVLQDKIYEALELIGELPPQPGEGGG